MQLFDMDNYPKLKFYRPIIVTPEFVARFEAKVVRDDGMPGGCHIWIGAKSKSGYGNVWNNGSILANRASYAIYNGEIPHGMLVCHTCDNPSCVNPAHLFLGSQRDNVQDCVSKGRNAMIRKTHCLRGHELMGDNLYLAKNGAARRCRLCAKNIDKLSYIKRRLAS